MPYYAKTGAIFAQGRKYVNAAIDFTEYSLEKTTITSAMIKQRVVRIGLSRSPTGSELQELNRLIQYGRDNGIKVVWEVF